jgi:hypothetical protein
VRKLIKIAVVALGIRALLRWHKRRKQQASAPSTAPPTTEDPADELRRKLAESRGDDSPAEKTATPVDASVAERREDVHEQGRAALDEMKSSSEA